MTRILDRLVRTRAALNRRIERSHAAAHDRIARLLVANRALLFGLIEAVESAGLPRTGCVISLQADNEDGTVELHAHHRNHVIRTLLNGNRVLEAEELEMAPDPPAFHVLAGTAELLEVHVMGYVLAS